MPTCADSEAAGEDVPAVNAVTLASEAVSQETEPAPDEAGTILAEMAVVPEREDRPELLG